MTEKVKDWIQEVADVKAEQNRLKERLEEAETLLELFSQSKGKRRIGVNIGEIGNDSYIALATSFKEMDDFLIEQILKTTIDVTTLQLANLDRELETAVTKAYQELYEVPSPLPL